MVSNRGVTPRGAARLIPQVDQRSQAFRKCSGLGFQRGQRPRLWACVDALQRRLGISIDGVGDQLPRDPRRHRPETLQLRRLVPAGQQRFVGEHEVHRHRNTRRHFGSGAPVEQQVHHQLIAGATTAVPGGDQAVRIPPQGRLQADRLLNWHQHTQIRHRIRRGACCDPPFGHSLAVPGHDRCGVEFHRQRLGPCDQTAVADPVQCDWVRTQPAVHDAPIRGRQARSLPHQQCGAPFVQPTRPQQGQGVRHLVHQRLRESEMPAAAVRGFSARKRNLRPDAPGPLGSREPPSFTVLSDTRRDIVSDHRLHRTPDRLQRLDRIEQFDAQSRIATRCLGTLQARRECAQFLEKYCPHNKPPPRLFEYLFDSSNSPCQWQ